MNNIVNNSFCIRFVRLLFGAGVFNFWCECVQCLVGFDSPTKLVSGGPRFMVDPTLRHCTFSMGWIRFVRSAVGLSRLC